MNIKLVIPRLISTALILTIAYFMILPMYDIIKASFKMQNYLESVNGNNYGLQYAFLQLMSIQPFFENIWMSFRISIFCALTSAFFCTTVAYGLVMYQFKFKSMVLVLLILMLLMPEGLKIIPFYLVLDQMGLIGKESTLWVPFTIPALSVFIIRQYIITTIRMDTVEAGRIEGASEWLIFRKIVVPLLMPALIVVLVIQFAFMWNQFDLAFFTLDDTAVQPITVIGRRDELPPIIYAVSSFFPLLILLLGSKYIIRFVDSAF
ncbi:MAG: carbohydrate ABC transporter permease [Saccharospirillaceae bacterium]|nr:ABC transporter permease subunit [Pseudomonadales bacterium]NRB77866.1 carbohydrate ABC transporter permease [Saccharospirillaceae bacterium]